MATQLDLDKERALLTRVRRERQEIALAHDRGEIVYVEEILPSLQQWVQDCTTYIDGIPEKYAAPLEAATGVEAKTALLREAMEGLREILGSYRWDTGAHE